MRAASAVHLWERRPDVRRNWDRVSDGFNILRPVLVSYDVEGLSAHYGEASWWDRGVSPYLRDFERFAFKDCISDTERRQKIDMGLALRILDQNWYTVFRSEFHSSSGLNWVKSAEDARRQWAHQADDDCPNEDAYSWLVDMWHLCLETDSDPDHKAADEIHDLMDEVLQGGSAKSAEKTDAKDAAEEEKKLPELKGEPPIEEAPASVKSVSAEEAPAAVVSPAASNGVAKTSGAATSVKGPSSEGSASAPVSAYDASAGAAFTATTGTQQGQQAGLPRNWGEPDANGFYPYDEVDPTGFTAPGEFVREILRRETPVSRDFIERRVREAFFPYRGRTGYAEREVVDRAYSGPKYRSFEERTFDDDGVTRRFIYNKEEPLKGPRYRGDSDRPIDQIPPEELEEGVYRVLKKKVSIEREELKSETFYAFGYRRFTENSSARLDGAIDALVEGGRASVSGSRVRLGNATGQKSSKAGSSAQKKTTTPKPAGKAVSTPATTSASKSTMASASKAKAASTKAGPTGSPASASKPVPKTEATSASKTATPKPAAATKKSEAARKTVSPKAADKAQTSSAYKSKAGAFTPKVASSSSVPSTSAAVAPAKASSSSLLEALETQARKALRESIEPSLAGFVSYEAVDCSKLAKLSDKDFVLAVLSVEAPIKVDVLVDYMQENLDSCRNRNESYIRSDIRKFVKKSEAFEERNGAIYRTSGVVCPRLQGSRKIKDIPVEELQAGALVVLLDAGKGIRSDDLITRTAQAFGCEDVRGAALPIKDAIDDLVSHPGHVHHYDGRAYRVLEENGVLTLREVEETEIAPAGQRPVAQTQSEPVGRASASDTTSNQSGQASKPGAQIKRPAAARAASTSNASDTQRANPPSRIAESYLKFDAYQPADVSKSYSSDKAFVYEVLKCEAPVHINLVYSRMAQRMGYRDNRAKNLQSAADIALASAIHEYGGFYRKGDYIYRYEQKITPRELGDREWDEVAPKELEAGLLQMLEWQREDGGADLVWDELIYTTYRMFKPDAGKRATPEDIALILLEALDRLIASGDVAYGGSDDVNTVVLKRRDGPKSGGDFKVAAAPQASDVPSQAERRSMDARASRAVQSSATKASTPSKQREKIKTRSRLVNHGRAILVTFATGTDARDINEHNARAAAAAYAKRNNIIEYLTCQSLKVRPHYSSRGLDGFTVRFKNIN